MSDSTDASSPCLGILELAHLVEQDGVTSDILPIYLQALLTVRLIEPDHLCRQAAARLSRHSPPLGSGDLAIAFRALAFQSSPQPATPVNAGPAAPTSSWTLKTLLGHIRRIWLLKSP